MRYRKLRIAWSVICGVACVLLVVLWVRSYWAVQCVERLTEGLWYEGIASERGVLRIWINGESRIEFDVNGLDASDPAVRSMNDHTGFPTQEPVGWNYVSYPPVGVDSGFGLIMDEYVFSFSVPHWFLVLAAGAIATIPWKPWRFSLRALLIATTLVAMVLGLIAYATQR
jgi:hypothetical protein